MAALDEGLILAVSFADVSAPHVEWVEDLRLEAGEFAWAFAAELFAPVCLEFQRLVDTERAQPQCHGLHEQQAVGGGFFVGVSEEDGGGF